MFSLDGGVKYWLYNKPVDMRKSFNGLSGIVTNVMCASLRSGDVYIFMNASRNMMKMLRREEGGLSGPICTPSRHGPYETRHYIIR